MTDLGDLFEREPVQWGLRGDPHLWHAMRSAFAGVPLPDSHWQVRTLIENEYRARVGDHMESRGAADVNVPGFRIGSGMSDGTVHREFWALTAVPLIVDRWMEATGRDSV